LQHGIKKDLVMEQDLITIADYQSIGFSQILRIEKQA
jgi:hypothetical protein